MTIVYCGLSVIAGVWFAWRVRGRMAEAEATTLANGLRQAMDDRQAALNDAAFYHALAVGHPVADTPTPRLRLVVGTIGDGA